MDAESQACGKLVSLLSQRLASGLLVLAVAAGACSSDPEPAPVALDATDPIEVEATTAEVEPVDASLALPEREGPRRQTSGSVPHVQLDAVQDAAVDAELRRRAFLLPGVEDLASVISLPGARGLSLTDDVVVRSPSEVLNGGREFAHFHPDGSLHVWLPVELAVEVERAKWGELHPWVDRDGFWDGVAMVYTPETMEELEIAMRIIVDAYNFVAGTNLEPADLN